ncbi:MAG: hypothetical protein IH996_08510 [Proteobacteria bacterium]|nr:hypothetical protein [Pseudomonadota bacterium]
MGEESLNAVVCRGQTYNLLLDRYWHLSHPEAGFLLHNTVLSEGLCMSISAITRMPNMEFAVSLYAMKTMTDEKEKVWEEVQLENDEKLPSRCGAVFLFDDRGIATQMLGTWFRNEPRHLLEVRVVQGSKMHRADTKWLDCTNDRWRRNAQRYWAGEMTANPVPEVLVDGKVYFPGWREAPFKVKT